MTKKIHLIAFSGSTRKDSFNKKLLKKSLEFFPNNVSVTWIDLKEFPMPFYDGDLEEEKGVPENAKKLRTLMMQADGFIVSSPEYNSSISAVLKNTIDWTSRADDQIPFLAAYKGKKAFVLSASVGKYGGIKSATALRSILEAIGVTLVPEVVAIANASKVFEQGEPHFEKGDLDLIEKGCKSLISLCS
jgi:chromate reductase